MYKIFVSIASYRDPELKKTIDDLILKAKNPELLKIVVYEQNDFNDNTVYGIYPENIVTVIRDHYTFAKGPNYARAIIQQKYDNEEYYLQIDSHMRCIKYWDHILKNMLNLLPEPAVLTQYPPEYNIDNDHIPNTIRSGLYVQGFGKLDKFTRIQSDIIKLENKRYYPYTSRAWSACFSFSKGSIVNDAPYDITLKHLFFGEELDITLKLFTRGYYLFSPHISVFYTYFKRNYRNTYWNDIPKSIRTPLEILSRYTLHKRINEYHIGKHAYGNIRSIKDYMKFAHIDDFKKCKMNKNAKTFRRHTFRELYK